MTAPLILERTAFLCALLYTVFYVAPFYLSPTLRSSPLHSRDAPTVIRARVRAVGLTCIACTAISVYVLTIHGHATPQDVLHLLGIWPIRLIDLLKVLGLVMVLFSCTLYENVVVDAEWRDWGLGALKEGLFDSWVAYRNLIVAPMSEEIVFRSLSVPLFQLAKMSPTRIVFITPFIFGLAHFHHLVEFLQARTPEGRRSQPLPIWINGLARSLFQLSYTSLFGFFAAFVLLRTGNIWAVIVAHSFCNRMGVPRLWGRVGQYEHMTSTVTPDVAQGKRDEDVHVPGSPVKVGNSLMQDDERISEPAGMVQQGPKNFGLGWSVVYYALVVLGAYGFYRLLWPLTDSPNALAMF